MTTLTLEQVLADAREHASTLKITGNSGQAAYLEQLLDCVASLTEDVRMFVGESDAALASGLAERTLRRRFNEWLETGHARYNVRNEREYRLDIVRRKPGRERAIRARVRRRLGRSAVT
ncbi:MAG TPA: hypothetical protein VGH98_16735 [Gemmatimonadaceae bacterium]|jgi:hypothetical protein